MWRMSEFFLKKFCATAKSKMSSGSGLLMPLLVELKPWQMVVFAQIAEELERNGFEVEPFGPQTLAVKAAPVGLEGAALERMLAEVIEQSARLRVNPSRMRILRHFVHGLPPPSHATPPSRSIHLLTRCEWNGYCWNSQRLSTQRVARTVVQSLCCIPGRISSGPSIEFKSHLR